MVFGNNNFVYLGDLSINDFIIGARYTADFTGLMTLLHGYVRVFKGTVLPDTWRVRAIMYSNADALLGVSNTVILPGVAGNYDVTFTFAGVNIVNGTQYKLCLNGNVARALNDIGFIYSALAGGFVQTCPWSLFVAPPDPIVWSPGSLTTLQCIYGVPPAAVLKRLLVGEGL